MKNAIIPNDIPARFDGTIIRYDKVPYLVRTNGDRFVLYEMNNLNGDPVKKVNAYDDLVDVSSCPLGYVWHDGIGVVGYLSRRPLRRYQQGINEQNVALELLPDHIKVPGEPLLKIRTFLHSKYFVNTVLNKYPNVDAALNYLRGSPHPVEVAISPDIAMSINLLGVVNVYFKNKLVGWIAPNTKTVNVPSNELGWIVSMHLDGFSWEIK